MVLVLEIQRYYEYRFAEYEYEYDSNIDAYGSRRQVAWVQTPG